MSGAVPHMGCRFPETEHTCYYLCEQQGCDRRDAEPVVGDLIRCPDHAPVVSR